MVLRRGNYKELALFAPAFPPLAAETTKEMQGQRKRSRNDDGKRRGETLVPPHG
ncbi:hypothetical protein BrE312_3065 [Brenneria sp. EniD312]|nr:hypothetical protein BrE312_3065 [Brenneria sp. EniD312]